MRLLSYVPVHNEANRYLKRTLSALADIVDDLAVFDDRSDDSTVDVARECGAIVGVREPDEVSFSEHEGQFRTLAWRYMEAVLKPERGDWIVALDADEVLLPDDGIDPRPLIMAAIGCAKYDVEGLTVPIDELWQLDPAMKRVDGHWGSITGTRIFRWSPGRSIADKPLGCGSVPLDGFKASVALPRIAHLGYVRRADREAKYERYRGRSGHGHRHVETILSSPTLQAVTLR